MRASEIATLPGTPDEAKSIAMRIVRRHQSINKFDVPLRLILKILHRKKFDIDRRTLIDILKNEAPIESISDDIIHIKQKKSDDEVSSDASDNKKEHDKDKVEKMAKKALKKKKGE